MMQRVMLFLLLVSATLQMTAQDVRTGKVIGQVQREQGGGVPHATVVLKQGATTMTDSAGYFELKSVPAGKQTLIISAAGYTTRTIPVQIQEGKEAFIGIQLSAEGFLNEVVVTAGRKPESIREVPSSVTIVQAKQIREQAAINPSITSILGNVVPGLGTFTNKATNSGQTLRGRSVLVLIDGIPQSTPLMNGSRDLRSIDPAIIERVEVIKGATSIYGNGSGGGIINLITKKAEGSKAISGETRIGGDGNLAHSDNTLGYRFSQTFHGTIKKFSYVVSGVYQRTGALKDADGNVIAQPDGLSETRLFNGFGKVSYQITDHQSVTFSYNFFRSRQYAEYINKAGKYGVYPAYGEKGDDPGDPAGTPHSHNMYLTYRATKLPLQSSLELTVYDHRFQSLNRYVEKSNSWYGPGQTYIQSYKQGVRANLNTPWKTKWLSGDVTYGLDVLKDRTNQVLTDGRVFVPDMRMHNVAPFAQVKADFHDLVIKGGIRYENAIIEVKDFSTIAKGANGEGSIAIKGGTLSYNATMFNVGMRYNKWAFFSPFASFSQAFGLNELGRVLRTAKENTLDQITTDPVVTNNYEAGFSNQWGPVSFTASYFVSTSKLGANLVEENGMFVTQREPERVHGYELVAEAKVLHNLRVGGSYSYVEGKSENASGTKVYMNGERIAPPKATGFINYQPITALNLQLSTVHTGSRNRFVPRSNGVYGLSEGPVKNVTYFNFNAGYNITSAFNLAVGVENLFNQSYYPPRSQYRVQDLEYVQGNGARLNLSIGYKF
ncbi:TonB-dependent receptor [Paraflavitalea sp. CAU 1676]|uniref:TonB-dependent receptor n=1 Tax=Paraflavitalea sp. CAU 1676 TaxID=3032598 RepID=UPI0023DB049C|nr:TonB-dependent receptor [Paraflavitalea sp. CAU 1676]MDF2192736.1 TonB-dependent receptor [Paraflavitalea sp. CAU 1676]